MTYYVAAKYASAEETVMYETKVRPGREVRRACRELCGTRTHPAPGHTRAEALQPWNGPVRIVSLAEQRRADRRRKETIYRALYGGVTPCL